MVLTEEQEHELAKQAKAEGLRGVGPSFQPRFEDADDMDADSASCPANFDQSDVERVDRNEALLDQPASRLSVIGDEAHQGDLAGEPTPKNARDWPRRPSNGDSFSRLARRANIFGGSGSSYGGATKTLKLDKATGYAVDSNPAMLLAQTANV